MKLPDILNESAPRYDRAAGAAGIVRPDFAATLKVGQYCDYYDHGTGDKRYGQVLKNDGRTVQISRYQEGEPRRTVRDYTVSDTYPGYGEEE